MNEFFSQKLFKYHNHYKDNSVDESYSISEIIEMHDSKVKDYVFDVVQSEALPHVPQEEGAGGKGQQSNAKEGEGKVKVDEKAKAKDRRANVNDKIDQKKNNEDEDGSDAEANQKRKSKGKKQAKKKQESSESFEGGEKLVEEQAKPILPQEEDQAAAAIATPRIFQLKVT